MRILQISSARAFGGGERHLCDLANALAGRGHQVYAALAPHSPLRDQLFALPERNVLTVRLRNALDLKSAVELARIVKERRIEVVHAHMARDYPLASLGVRPNRRQARLILTRHVLFPLHKLHAVILSPVSRVIAVSQGVGRALRAQRIFPANKITVVPNGVDLARFDQSLRNFNRDAFRRRLNLAPERLLVGTVGEINRLKGQEEFLRAAGIIARRVDNADFIIAGEDTSRTGEHRTMVEHLIAELGLKARVHVLGWLDDVAPLLGALDVFVSASRSESFGLAIAEAMTCGAPIVATMTDGAREIIEDGLTGVLVPVGDVEVLATSVISLLEDVDERKRLSVLAREAVRERLSLDQMVTATEQIYREAVAKE